MTNLERAVTVKALVSVIRTTRWKIERTMSDGGKVDIHDGVGPFFKIMAAENDLDQWADNLLRPDSTDAETCAKVAEVASE